MKRTTFAAILLSLAVGTVTMGWAPVLAAPVPAADANKEVVLKSKVDAVTVYRGQALVTRVADLPAGAGLGEIVVSELPERIVPSSIFAEGSEGVEIRSVVYRDRPVAQDVRSEVSKIDDDIRGVNDELADIAKQQQLLQEQRAFLDKLANFTAPTANVEMTKGVLNADQLKKLTTDQFEQRKAIAKDELELGKKHRAASERLALLQRQRGDVTGRSSRTLREAVVFVSRKNGGKLNLRYLVDAASWSPSYNIRADAAKKAATVEYQASIQQMSGEDWGDVSMTLSTATPNLIAAAPMLNPLSIALNTTEFERVKQLAAKLDYKAAKDQLQEQQEKAEMQRSISNSFSGQLTMNGGNLVLSNANPSGNATFSAQRQGSNPNYDNDKDLNKVADQMQILELLAADGRKGDIRGRAATEGIVVTYEMRSRTSLPSRSDQQLIQIDSVKLKSDFYKVAVPVLTTYVYDQATLTNNSSLVLLAGPVSSYVGGQFVGSGSVPTVAVGQPFTVGFGIDSSLRAFRERVDKTEQTQGGNKVVSYAYRVAVDNYGSAPANVRIMDRLPTAKDSEVRVTFAEAVDHMQLPAKEGEPAVATVESKKIPLSADPEYLQTERKKGILRWDVVVPAEKRGSEAFSLYYKLNMEYDKSLAISAASVLRDEDIRNLLDSNMRK